MDALLSGLSAALKPSGKPFGGVLFWDLCRLFGSSGKSAFLGVSCQ
jgi:hypothetical protein